MGEFGECVFKFSRKIRLSPEADFGEILNEFWKILHENFSKLMEYFPKIVMLSL